MAGASGMSAWVFIHPADLVKTRMQLLGDEKGDANALSVGRDLVSTPPTIPICLIWYSPFIMLVEERAQFQ